MSNILHGRYISGRFVWTQGPKQSGSSGGGGDKPITPKYLPGLYKMVVYKKDGTIAAVFGSGSESDMLSKLTFELTTTGCGQFSVTFSKLPTLAELSYMQRVDIFLFNDAVPWYSGYVLKRPIKGTTESTYTFSGYGYYNALENVLVFGTYENKDPGDIVRELARLAEERIGTIYNSTKIINANYIISKLVFEGVTLKDALSKLSNFAIDYVYGVDEQRQLYFHPRTTKINEQARFWVGQHINTYVPTWDASRIVNWARIKGGKVDDEGEQWLATVEDKESQEKYGYRSEIWTLPEAYDTADAQRWGESQIQQYKEPTKSAKITGIRLEYPNADGSFNVRKLSTDGMAAINDLNGDMVTYPISKLKYTVSADGGISCDAELGDQLTSIDKYFAELDRNAKNAEALNSASTKQIKGGINANT